MEQWPTTFFPCNLKSRYRKDLKPTGFGSIETNCIALIQKSFSEHELGNVLTQNWENLSEHTFKSLIVMRNLLEFHLDVGPRFEAELGWISWLNYWLRWW